MIEFEEHWAGSESIVFVAHLKEIETFLSIIVGGCQEEPGGKEFVIGSGFEEDKESCKVKKNCQEENVSG